MLIRIDIPQCLARSFNGSASELPRRILEAATAHQYRTGQITHAEVAGILGLSRWETDAFLKEKNAFQKTDLSEYTEDSNVLKTML
jgi:hypothetical protein